MVYATLGALIVRRARNVVGWILLAEGLAFTVISAAGAYGVSGIVGHHGSIPAPRLIGALGDWVFRAAAVALAYMFFFFPTGTLPSRRWRPVLAVGVAAAVGTEGAWILNPMSVGIPAPGGALRFVNPGAVGALGDVVGPVLVGAAWVVALTVAAAFAAGRPVREGKRPQLTAA